MNLLRSEWLKLWTTRTTWVMLGIGLLGEALFAGLYAGLASLGDVERTAGRRRNRDRRRPADGADARARGPDRHHRVPPRDLELDLPRLAEALPGAAGEARRLAARRPAGRPRLRRRQRRPLALADRRPRRRSARRPAISSRSTPASSLSFAILAAFGFGVGAIVRNQVGAIIAAIAFFFVLSPLPELLPGLDRRILPGPGARRPPRPPRRRRRPRPGHAAASSSPPGRRAWSRSASR